MPGAKPKYFAPGPNKSGRDLVTKEHQMHMRRLANVRSSIPKTNTAPPRRKQAKKASSARRPVRPRESDYAVSQHMTNVDLMRYKCYMAKPSVSSQRSDREVTPRPSAKPLRNPYEWSEHERRLRFMKSRWVCVYQLPPAYIVLL
ncbi:hypothetical protein KIPB_013483 [Kipferlia bialata]|uniref:Uncharacterized protein n=1 Tax=Kipferlia bialata TaxID=797122 RepID=A0A391NS44_9EUKA|nr:hypothetical protein KIPB_013483 [Kipferlia bialata]|eukprot:g13483.t1